MARLAAGVLVLALSVLPTAAVLCCAWSPTAATEASAPSCHHVQPTAEATANLQAAGQCAPHAPSVLGQTETPRTLIRALAAPVWERATPAVNRAPVATTDPVPVPHVPKHLLHTVLLI